MGMLKEMAYSFTDDKKKQISYCIIHAVLGRMQS